LFWCLWAILIKRQKTLIIVVTPVIIYMAISMMSNINIGVRHLAPLFPFLFLMGGALLDQLFKTRKLGRLAPIVGLVLLGWMVFVAIRAYPDYLSYTSPLVFGRQNWEVLSDSNIEWGQDVGALARYLHERGETRVGASLSGGWVTLHLYGIQYINLFNENEVARSPSRYVAVGAGFLNGSTVPAGIKGPNGFLTDDERVRFFESYRDQKPEAVFGNSIYLFRTKDQPQ
jgi:hypothetical protein